MVYLASILLHLPHSLLVAQRAVSVVVLPNGNTETEESRHVHRVPGRAVGLQGQACVGIAD